MFLWRCGGDESLQQFSAAERSERGGPATISSHRPASHLLPDRTAGLDPVQRAQSLPRSQKPVACLTDVWRGTPAVFKGAPLTESLLAGICGAPPPPPPAHVRKGGETKRDQIRLSDA